jgi:hypothetical protein
MKPLFHPLLIIIISSMLASCATSVPNEMKLADPNNRKTINQPGTNIEAMRFACAETMLNASPATEASDIVVRVLSTSNPTIMEVDAILKNVGAFRGNLSVTYHCEYQNGSLTLGTWTRGLKGTS